MADLKLDILVVPTYSKLTLGIADGSVYPNDFYISSPSLEITIPGLGVTVVPFVPNDFNVLTSSSLGITLDPVAYAPIPDGVYKIKYSVAPAYENNVTKTFMRVEQLQEKFDEAFMKLDMMECDMAIKKQQKVKLNSIYYLIQGAVAAANNCAVDAANKLYDKASRLLKSFVQNNCGCSGTNFNSNFH
jgi:hypothetical protein